MPEIRLHGGPWNGDKVNIPQHLFESGVFRIRNPEPFKLSMSEHKPKPERPQIGTYRSVPDCLRIFEWAGWD